jgi:hypothetical protein
LIHVNMLLHQGFDMTAKSWHPTSKFSVFSCMSFVLCSMSCLLSTLHRKIHVDPFFSNELKHKIESRHRGNGSPQRFWRTTAWKNQRNQRSGPKQNPPTIDL